MWPTFFMAGGLDTNDLIEIASIGCNLHTIDYTPSTHTPSAQAGDLVVVVVNNIYCTLSPADSMNQYLHGYLEGRLYGPPRLAVFYKFLEQADLSSTFSFTHVNASDELCGKAYVIRNAHTNVPLDGFSFFHYRSVNNGTTYWCRMLGGLAPNIAPAPNAIQFAAMSYRAPGTSGQALISDLTQLNSDWLYPWHSFQDLASSGGLGYGGLVGIRFAGTESLRNLLTNESYDNILTDWVTNGGLDNFDHGLTTLTSSNTNYARLNCDNVNGLHYVSFDIDLVDGEEYTLCVSHWVQPSASSYMGLSVVPPSGSSNEFGFVEHGYGSGLTSTVDETGTWYTDPQSGKETWWWGHVHYSQEDGSPSSFFNPVTLAFIAQETGTHELRIYVANGDAWADTTHGNTNAEIRIGHAAFFSGMVGACWLPSTPSGYQSLAQPGPLFFDSDPTTVWNDAASTTQQSCFGFFVNSSGSLPAATMASFEATAFGGLELSGDGLSRPDGGNVNPTDDGLHGVICTRQVYPTIDGADAKYYAEFEIDAINGSATSGHSIGVGPLHASFADHENSTNYGAYYWQQTGTFSNPGGTPPANSAWSVVAGDKIGVMVDYANDQVIFYKNGTATGTLSMHTGAGYEHEKLPFALYWYGCLSGSTNLAWTANLTGPFGGRKPSGAVAWDYDNEVA